MAYDHPDDQAGYKHRDDADIPKQKTIEPLNIAGEFCGGRLKVHAILDWLADAWQIAKHGFLGLGKACHQGRAGCAANPE